MLESTSGLVLEAVEYTDYLSATANLNQTDTFTVASAPDWYAPALPRPMANVGWTFEGLRSGIDSGKRYSLVIWSGFFGYMVSLPIQFIKMLFQLSQFLGPFGLFLIWLLVMFPFVLGAKIIIFIKNLFVRLINFIFKLIQFIGDIWGLIPFL